MFYYNLFKEENRSIGIPILKNYIIMYYLFFS